MHHLAQKAAQNLEAVRQQKPLIHNITNYVVMNYTANALLAMGASPVMAHAPNEVEEMVAFARSLVLNIGTLTDDWVESMIKAGCKASGQNTPIILDPVGSGATASEILSLRDANSKTKGVDSIHSVDDAAEAAQTLATELNTTLAITGPTDLITNGKQIVRVDNGHPLMGYVTGTGCTATVVVGAFLAVDPDPLSATATALAYFGLAGEKAGQTAEAPGSFMIALLDALYTISPEDLQNGCRIREN